MRKVLALVVGLLGLRQPGLHHLVEQLAELHTRPAMLAEEPHGVPLLVGGPAELLAPASLAGLAAEDAVDLADGEDGPVPAGAQLGPRNPVTDQVDHGAEKSAARAGPCGGRLRRARQARPGCSSGCKGGSAARRRDTRRTSAGRDVEGAAWSTSPASAAGTVTGRP